jgi:N-acetylglucosamine kinase-like BadF-type ATPase
MLAGAGRPDDVTRVTESLTNDSPFGSCGRLTITSDIQPLIFEARDSHPDSSSIVVISGTGSLVAAFDKEERVVRAGGWGPVLGDEGSGWGLARAFLKTFSSWIDSGRDADHLPEGFQMLGGFLASKHLQTDPQQLNAAIIALVSDRHLAAQLAPSILELATQPSMTATSKLVNEQIALLADQVQQVHSRLAIANSEWHLCLAGGLASNDTRFQNILSTELKRRAIAPTSVSILDPLNAALSFAARV